MPGMDMMKMGIKKDNSLVLSAVVLYGLMLNCFYSGIRTTYTFNDEQRYKIFQWTVFHVYKKPHGSRNVTF